MAFDFVVAPGTILKEYMEDRKISQKDLARYTNSSERHISNIINSKVKFSEEFALKLENVFPDVKAEFWKDLDSHYQINKLRQNKNNASEDLDKLAKDFQFDYLFKGLGYSIQKKAAKMLEFLDVKSFSEADKEIAELSYSFMEDSGNKRAIYVWLKLCEEALEIQNDMDQIKSFDWTGFKKSLPALKKLMYIEDFDFAIDNLRKYLNKLGVALVIHEAVPTSKVRGATTFIDGMPVIFLSTRFKRLDIFYFTLIHEISHILHSKDSGEHYDILYEDEEFLSNSYARNFFIAQDDYRSFINQHGDTGVTEKEILEFSRKHKVIPSVLIGFLEHDKIINNHARFSHMKIFFNKGR